LGDKRLTLLEIQNEILIEASGDYWSFWVDPAGKLYNIGNKEHADFFQSNLKKFGVKNIDDIYKTSTDIYDFAYKLGWVRGRLDDTEISFEFYGKVVTKNTIKLLIKFTSLRSKDRVNSVYYDIYLGGRSIRGTDMPDKAIKILRKFGK
jgi:hypothetical protein